MEPESKRNQSHSNEKQRGGPWEQPAAELIQSHPGVPLSATVSIRGQEPLRTLEVGMPPQVPTLKIETSVTQESSVFHLSISDF